AAGAGETMPLPAAAHARRSMMVRVLERLRDPTVRICSTRIASRHTAVIEAIHAAGPVAAIDPSLVSWVTDDSGIGQLPEVAGLTAAMEKAYVAGCSLAEVGFVSSGLTA